MKDDEGGEKGEGSVREIELAVGCFDGEFLGLETGEMENGSRDEEWKEHRNRGFANVLASSRGDHFYVRDEINGITDWVSREGTRFWEGSAGGAMQEENSKTKI